MAQNGFILLVTRASGVEDESRTGLPFPRVRSAELCLRFRSIERGRILGFRGR